jgi:hypothetical protein
MIVCASTAKGQSKSDMWVNRETYRQNLSDLASLRAQVASLEQLKFDTLMYKRTIVLKDQAFRMLQEQLSFNRQLVDTLTSIKNQQAAIIANQGLALVQKDKTIDKMGKPKRFGVGPVGGYGLSGVGLNTFLGIGISYSLFRF